jgi:hypothetical protein
MLLASSSGAIFKDMKGASLYCYAQSCDPLIDAGWVIADID